MKRSSFIKIICILTACTLLIFTMVKPEKAEPWTSKIENQYAQYHPVLFEKYTTAKQLINSHELGDDNLDEARNHLNEILEAELNFAPALREYARLYIKSNDGEFEDDTLKKAEKVILHAIKIEPDYADAYVLLGHVYTLKYLYIKAEEALQTADEMGARTPWLNLNFAYLLESQGQRSAAQALYKLVIDTEAEDTRIYSYALHRNAINYQYNGQYAEADEWYQKSIAVAPTAESLTDYSNFLLFQLGDADGAIQYGEQALKKYSFSHAEFTVGSAYYTKWARVKKLHGEVTAKSYYDRAHEILPDIDDAYEEISSFPPTRDAAETICEKMKELSDDHWSQKKRL